MNDSEKNFEVVIVGSGPAGLSAAGRAAAHGMRHIVLEKSDRICETVSQYQRGKLIMATPYSLPSRGGIAFEEGLREEVLARWNREVEEKGLNIRLKAEVVEIEGESGNFSVILADGDVLKAETVVLALGLQGNIRTLDVPGSEWIGVGYSLEDADDHVGEQIAVIGAGDSGIENALALSEQNTVTLINRNNDLVRATDRNATRALDAIDKRRIAYYSEARPMRIAEGELQLELKSGATTITCDRIIARLGARPPRDFLSRLGIAFHGDLEEASPVVDGHYQTNIPGIYIVGSLAGFPLIKHAVNQGYEVIDFIKGIDTSYADDDLLKQTLAPLLATHTLDDLLDGLRDRLPLLAELTELQLREFLLDVKVHEMQRGEFVFQRDDYGDSIYLIYQGSAVGLRDVDEGAANFDYPEGDYFGEIGMIAGRRRIFSVQAGADNNIFIEVPRSACLKWCAAVKSMQTMIERSSMARELRAYLSTEFSEVEFDRLLSEIELRVFKAGDYLYQAGDSSDGIYLIRKGSVTVSRDKNGVEMAISYVPAGNYLGETSLLSGSNRASNVRAAVECRTVFIPADTFQRLVETQPEFRRRNERKILDQISENEARRDSTISIEQIVQQGLGDATDMLLVDENICIRCDNCETACAKTHGGTSRLDLKAGTTMGSVRIPTSCRHCEHPHCMSDCPTDAIQRSQSGEVLIDENCIGCGNCVQNCPYNVIRLEEASGSGETLIERFMAKIGLAPTDTHESADLRQLAVKCDMCADFATGPACVNACPTGAAARMTPERAFELVDAR